MKAAVFFAVCVFVAWTSAVADSVTAGSWPHGASPPDCVRRYRTGCEERRSAVHAEDDLTAKWRSAEDDLTGTRGSAEDNFTGTLGSDDGWSAAFFARGFTSTDWECSNFTEAIHGLHVSGDTVVVAGPFSHVADRPAAGVALWDGRQWSEFGSEAPPIRVRDADVYRGRVVVAGAPDAGWAGDPVLQWTGSRWEPIGLPALRGAVSDLLIDGGDLLAAGEFRLDDTLRSAVVRFDGAVWRRMDAGLGGGSGIWAKVLHRVGDRLFAGGSFRSEESDSSRFDLAAWDGDRWRTVPGLSARSWVTALAEHEGALVVGGGLRLASDPGGRYAVLRWSGLDWSPLDLGFPGPQYEGSPSITSICRWDGALWVAGYYGTDYSIEPLLASFADGYWTDERPATWSCWGREFSRIAPYKDGIVLTGSFVRLAEEVAGHIAFRGKDGWHGIGPTGAGIDGIAYSFLPLDDRLYVAGDFRCASSGEDMAGIGSWDGHAWHPLGEGPPGEVYALAWFRDRLIAGGRFQRPGDGSLAAIAEWDGARWSVPPGGPEGAVYELIVHRGELIAGGSFWRADGQIVANIARWDGSQWSALGKGVRGYNDQAVFSLATYRDELVVAGAFYRAGDIEVPGIARWDGLRWNSMGVPTWTFDDGPARSLVVWNGTLVARGGQASWDGTGGHLAVWDGTVWKDIPVPMFGDANALGVYKGLLLVAGRFPAPNGRRELLALWDGENAFRLGSGVNGDWLNAAAVWNGSLFLGGAVRVAGNKPSRGIACYTGQDLDDPVFPLDVAARPSPSRGPTTIVLQSPERRSARLDIFDVQGRKQGAVWSGMCEPGETAIRWDGRDGSGNPVPSGVYYLRMETADGTRTRAMVILR